MGKIGADILVLGGQQITVTGNNFFVNGAIASGVGGSGANIYLSNLPDVGLARSNLGIETLLSTQRANMGLAMIAGRISTYSDFTNWSTHLSGSATVAKGPRCVTLTSSVTSSSAATMREASGNSFGGGRSLNNDRALLNWNSRISVGMTVTTESSSVNGNFFGYLGADASATITHIATPPTKAIGFRANENVLYGIAHNGTSLTATALNITILDSNPRDLIAVSDGLGNVDYYVNDLLLGSTSSGPTGTSLSHFWGFIAGARNNADSSQNRWSVHHVGIYSE